MPKVMEALKNPLTIILLAALSACNTRHRAHEAATSARVTYDLALEAFDADSVRLGETLLHEAMRRAATDDDLHTLYLAQLRLAESLAWGNTEGALDMARQALETYMRRPDSERNHIIILDNIGTYASQLAYNTDGSFDEALTYTRRAYELAVASRDSLGTELISQTLTSLANIHWATDDYAEALRCAREAEACATPELLLGAQQVLARCLVSCDSMQSAEEVYRRMQPGEDLQAAYIVQSNLAKLALHRHDIATAEEAIDSAFEHAEELYYTALRQKDDYYQNALRQQAENERLSYAAALQRRTLWGSLAAALVLALVGGIIVRDRLRISGQRRLAEVWRRKHEVDARIHESRLRRSEARLHEQQMLMHEQEAAAQREQLRQRDGTVAFLQGFILERSAVIQKLDASADRHVALSSHEWAEVERTLDAIDGDRISHLRLRYPDMREEDLQLCILTRLRLTNRAIGNIYGISISAVQHRKLRIKKDIFGESDPDTTFEQVLETI